MRQGLIQRKAIAFEEKYGSIAFLKLALSSLHRLLVEDGIVSEESIQVSLLEELERESKKRKGRS